MRRTVAAVVMALVMLEEGTFLQAEELTLPFDGTTAGSPAFSATTTAGTMGVRGLATNTAGVINSGGYFEAYGSQGRGVWGITNGAASAGVRGEVVATSGANYGVYGKTVSPDGWGGYFEGRGYFSGSLGIGTTNPAQKLHVVGLGQFDLPTGQINISTPGGIPGLITFAKNGHRRDIAFGDLGIALTGNTSNVLPPVTQGLFIHENGNVGIGTQAPATRLEVRGNLRVSNAAGQPVVELGEGLDYAEGFHVADKDSVGPGTVLVIDAEHPGRLATSTQAYDTKVAGIVSGAKGLGSAVRLGVGQFDRDVALAGRVYCNVDATFGAVQPGDLLTTSATPGYAMVVKDHTEATGAILGKAMERLPKGAKGQILVLVTLQ